MLKTKRKGIFSVILAFMMFVGAVCGSYSTFVEANAADDYRTWSQLDERWAGVSMGGSTIRQSGCLITSLAIMAVHSGSVDSQACANMGINSVEEFNPGVLANAYTARNGFTYGGAIASWGTIHTIIPQISFITDSYFSSRTQSGIASEIQSLINQGMHLIVNVGGHWVYVEGTVGDEVYMLDPAKDETLLFNAYSAANMGEYWALTGANAPTEVSAGTVTESTTATTPSTTTTSLTTTTVTTTVSSKITTTTETTTTVSETSASAETSTAEISETTSVQSTQFPTTYYYSGDEPAAVTSVFGTAAGNIAELSDGYIVSVIRVENGQGLVRIGGEYGWIDMDNMIPAENEAEAQSGDINNDGIVDFYDLSLLNEYIKSLKYLPEGVSLLSEAEISAADLNGDGIADKSDVLEYLSVICG